MRSKTARAVNKLLDDDAYKLASNPDKPRAAPPRAAEVPYLNFAELDNAGAEIGAERQSVRQGICAPRCRRCCGPNGERERVNSMLAILEQSLTDPRGLPGREWYQHMIYAPGAHTGYGVKTLPGIREAIEERRWEEANQYIGVVSRALNAYSAQIGSRHCGAVAYGARFRSIVIVVYRA